MIALYVRVSSAEQAKDGYSIDEQIQRLKSYSMAMGWKDAKVYTDPGFSGASLDRPALKELISDVKANKITRVVVWKLDRLSRSQKDTLYLIEDVFRANGCDFVSMTENFDTGTPFGVAMIGILAVFAQLEREKIKERMSMGKAGRNREGKWRGGGNVPIGYRYEGGELQVDPFEAMQVREAFDLLLSGVGTYTITETTTPSGYNTIDPITFTISFNAEKKEFSTDNEKILVNGNTNTLLSEIVNVSGSTLPSTGGMGTTLFYTFGGIMVLAAVVLLVTKKRMAV